MVCVTSSGRMTSWKHLWSLKLCFYEMAVPRYVGNIYRSDHSALSLNVRIGLTDLDLSHFIPPWHVQC
jgi:hypothetical protein